MQSHEKSCKIIMNYNDYKMNQRIKYKYIVIVWYMKLWMVCCFGEILIGK